jgi:hypothetical protein
MKNAPGSKRGGKKREQVIEEQIIVLLDGDGNYYEIPRATLERSRVPDSETHHVEQKLVDMPEKFVWIHRTAVPGSIAAGSLEGGRALHYAGFYLRTTKSKR